LADPTHAALEVLKPNGQVVPLDGPTDGWTIRSGRWAWPVIVGAFAHRVGRELRSLPGVSR